MTVTDRTDPCGCRLQLVDAGMDSGEGWEVYEPCAAHGPPTGGPSHHYDWRIGQTVDAVLAATRPQIEEKGGYDITVERSRRDVEFNDLIVKITWTMPPGHSHYYGFFAPVDGCET